VGALTPNPNLEIRMVFRITKDDSAHQGMLYKLAAGRQFNLGAIALQGNTLKIAIPPDGHLDSPTCGHQKFPHPRRELQEDEKGKIF
jgi:hypothetical protein